MQKSISIHRNIIEYNILSFSIVKFKSSFACATRARRVRKPLVCFVFLRARRACVESAFQQTTNATLRVYSVCTAFVHVSVGPVPRAVFKGRSGAHIFKKWWHVVHGTLRSQSANARVPTRARANGCKIWNSEFGEQIQNYFRGPKSLRLVLGFIQL